MHLVGFPKAYFCTSSDAEPILMNYTHRPLVMQQKLTESRLSFAGLPFLRDSKAMARAKISKNFTNFTRQSLLSQVFQAVLEKSSIMPFMASEGTAQSLIKLRLWS